METPSQAANWKKYLRTGISVALDFKVMGLVMLNVMLLYMGAWDTVMRPHLEQMQGRDKALEEQKKSLQEKEGLQKQYNTLEQQLKSLDTELMAVSQGNSAKVISVTEAADLLELAKGSLRDEQVLPRLLPPHDQRANVSLTFTANKTIDILKPDEPVGGAPGAPAGEPPAAMPTPPASGPGDLAGGQAPKGKGMPGAAAGQPAQVGSSTLPVERYDYDLKVTGTYPALMDVVNELVIRKKLIHINKVVISRPTIPEPQPDAKDVPDFPVKLDMVVSLSMFLYAPVAP